MSPSPNVEDTDEPGQLKLAFVDVETTGLRHDDEVWELAVVARFADGSQGEHHLFLDHDRAKCRKLPEKFLADHDDRYRACRAAKTDPALAVFLESLLRGAHLVGQNPAFDAGHLERLMRRHGVEPSWHYHLIDVSNLALGWLAAKGTPIQLPYRSDELAAALGVEPPPEGERHTALGDARWAMRIYDAIAGATP